MRGWLANSQDQIRPDPSGSRYGSQTVCALGAWVVGRAAFPGLSTQGEGLKTLWGPASVTHASTGPSAPGRSRRGPHSPHRHWPHYVWIVQNSNCGPGPPLWKTLQSRGRCGEPSAPTYMSPVSTCQALGASRCIRAGGPQCCREAGLDSNIWAWGSSGWIEGQ